METLCWCDEIVVVDMESDDRTVEIARSFGARVLSHPREGWVEPARQFGIAQCQGNWILIVDADEMLPPSLARKLQEISPRR